MIGVWSTPRNPESHARDLARDVDLCAHRITEESLEEDQSDA